ncbi:hypothetical protein E8E12_004523 [Didymella heteroderae]|uniref:Uncharacterized protein n=1 Tax=Didymella heteroderae TaxID=1769908 RepID=A0A9P4WJ41_9PLEO|nr:hypothetical protein E8E12_004523 [Didymella heteroderae]
MTNTRDGWGWATASDGALSFSSDAPSASATLFNAWLANMPQVLLSVCYMSLNSFCTAMASAKEWNNLALSRNGLRVSEPRGQQRSTYFLQLPYRWAMPLIALSTALHWLLSQTFFLVRIDVFNARGNLITKGNEASRSACGVSVSSFIVFFVVFLSLCIGIRVLASRKFVTGLPQAASNSLVISAACHPPKDEVEPHLKAVQWGVVEGEMVGGYEHCSLSSRLVGIPEEGNVYC